MPKANIVYFKITGSAPGAIIDMFHLLVNAKKCIDSDNIVDLEHFEYTLTAVIRMLPMIMIIIMIMMSKKFILTFNSRADGWLSRSQNGEKDSYSPARHNKIAVTLRAGKP